MELNYTPLDLDLFEKKHFPVKKTGFDVILLLIGIFTLLVLSVLICILIQKRTAPAQKQVATPTPISKPTAVPTETPVPETPTPTLVEVSPTVEESTPSGEVQPPAGNPPTDVTSEPVPSDTPTQ